MEPALADTTFADVIQYLALALAVVIVFSLLTRKTS